MDILLSFFLCLLLLVEYGETTSRVLRRHLLEVQVFAAGLHFYVISKLSFGFFLSQVE